MEPDRLKIARRRQGILHLAMLLFAARLAWSFFDIQVLSHDTYVEAAQRQQKKRIEIPPSRGTIYDRHGVPLAVNREQYAIFLVPRSIGDVDRFAERFTSLVPYDERELRKRIAQGGWYVRLIRGISRETVRKIEAADLEGVGVETYQVRHYPYGELAASVLGRVDVDNVGIEGLELQYDEALRGTPGYTIHQRDAVGREYANFNYAVQAPVHGRDVTLTIDLGLQEIVEAALDGAMERTRARMGSVVVVDPRTGEVLAMANRASAAMENRAPRTNFAVVDQFEPGSTFKIVTLAGLYEERLAAPTDSLFCENGTWNYDGRILRDVHPYGMLSVEEVIEESSNICAAKLTAWLGDDRVYEYARRFGFGLPAGLDFPGEPRGVLKRPDQWSSLTSASVAMGYEVMVTSMQMVMAYAAIANGGELLRPYLVRKVVEPSGDVAFSGSPQRIRRVMSEETARLITQALVRVVEVGTARSAQLEVLPVAGKTGTARKIGERGYVRGRYTSSFIGFFPAQEARYAMFVRIDEPVGAFYGGTVAAPVFHETMESTLLAEGLTQSPGLVERLRGAERVVWTVSDSMVDLPPLADPLPPDADAASRDRLPAFPVEGRWRPVLEPIPDLAGQAARPSVVDVASGSEEGAEPFDPRTQVKVPDFAGLALREAVGQAARLGLAVTFDGTGRVVDQDPEPGEVVPRGGVIRLANRP